MNNSILDYTDYRAFLNAHFEDKKRQNSHFSFGVWARALGLKNNTSLLKILNGQRNAGPAIQENLANYFKFDQRERAYFSDLVQLAKVKSDSPLHGTLIERLAVRHTASRFQVLTNAQFSVISDWWCYAIRQLTKLPSFVSDPTDIARHLRFAVTPKQVTTAIRRMTELKMLTAKDDGTLEATPEPVRTTYDVSNEAIKRFHEASFENCKKSVRDVPVEQREHSAYVFAFNDAEVPEAKEFLRSMVDQFEARFGSSKTPNQIYQLQLALIPLTKNVSKQRKD
jgi:uncharacterized protein (TIGR02147 family)